jgi:hypothetical protein
MRPAWIDDCPKTKCPKTNVKGLQGESRLSMACAPEGVLFDKFRV